MFSHTNKTIVLGDVTLSLADFKTVEPDYHLPKGYKGQLLNPDGHYLITKDGHQEFQQESWKDGLKYYTNRYIYLAKVNSGKNVNKVQTTSSSIAIVEILQLPVEERKKEITALNPSPSLEALEQSLRVIRNRLLQESDYTQLADVAVVKSLWAKYRQELRDLPLQGHPLVIEWPVPPSV